MSTATITKKTTAMKEGQKSLAANDLAIWLLPRLREYTQKLNELCERATQFPMTILPHNIHAYTKLFAAEYCRIISTYQTISRGITKQIGSASTILDHAKLDLEIEEELELRTQEAINALNCSDYTMKTVMIYAKDNGLAKAIEQSLTDFQIKVIE